jgi:3-methylcrotonyl-CoA carboxylase alpha subunit
LDVILESSAERMPVAVGINTVYIGQSAVRVGDVQYASSAVSATVDGCRWFAQIVRRGDRVTVWAEGRCWEASVLILPSQGTVDAGTDRDCIVALMPGSVLQVHVGAGDSVRAGQPIVTMESMKMQMSLDAQMDGVIALIHVQPGSTVDKGDILVEFEQQA